ELDVALAVFGRRLSERSAGRIVVRSAPVRVIEHIKGLGAELEAYRLRDRELLVQADIPIPESGIVDPISHIRLHIERALGRCGKDRRSVGIADGEPLGGIFGAARGKLVYDIRIAVDYPELPGLDVARVPVAVLSDAHVIIVRYYIASISGLKLRNTAD